MKLTRIVAHMDSGAEFCTAYDKPEVTAQNLKNIRLGIEEVCADGSDFLITEVGLLCISKIESIYIQSKKVDDD